MPLGVAYNASLRSLYFSCHACGAAGAYYIIVRRQKHVRHVVHVGQPVLTASVSEEGRAHVTDQLMLILA